MAVVAEVALPLFAILLLGFGASKSGLFDEQANRGLARFVFYFVIPPLLFRSVAQTELPAALPWRLLAAYYLATLLVFALGMLSARGRGLAAASMIGFGAAYGNTVLMGIPLVLTVFGEAAALPLFLIVAAHSPLLLTLLTLLIEFARGRRRPGVFWQVAGGACAGLARNPVVLSLLAGIAVNLLGWSLPAPVDAVAAALGQAATPCALFSMGAALAAYRIAGNLSEALGVVILKNLLHPLLVWLCAIQLFGLPALTAQTLTLLAALPCGVNAYLFAQRYRVAEETVTTAIFVSTAASLSSLSLLIALWAG